MLSDVSMAMAHLATPLLLAYAAPTYDYCCRHVSFTCAEDYGSRRTMYCFFIYVTVISRPHASKFSMSARQEWQE